MSKTLLALIMTFQLGISFGQQSEIINTDRPDQSDGTYTLTKKYLQIENGITALNGSFQNNLMLRYGITNSTEIRLLFDFEKNSQSLGLTPIGLSLKQKLVRGNEIIPDITFVTYLRNGNLASKDFRDANYSYSLLLAFQNTINDNFSIGYNLSSNNINNNIGFTTSLGYSFNKKITAFVEYFSQFNTLQLPEHNVDGGLLYIHKNNLQFDIAIGKSLTASNNLLYLTTGISYKLKLHN